MPKIDKKALLQFGLGAVALVIVTWVWPEAFRQVLRKILYEPLLAVFGEEAFQSIILWLAIPVGLGSVAAACYIFRKITGRASR